MKRRLPIRTAAAGAAAVALVACADSTPDEDPGASPEAGEPTADEPSPEDPGDTTTLEGDLPPLDPLELEQLYGEELAELGVELTDRGGLIDPSDSYQVSEGGTHLAVYVAPTTDRSEQDYLDGIVEVAAVFAQDVFERWPGLETFDVCQELPADEVEEGDVLTVSQVDLSRQAAASIDWTSATLEDLFVAAETDDRSDVRTFGDLFRHPDILEARAAARS